jgi:hypothetical protein
MSARIGADHLGHSKAVVALCDCPADITGCVFSSLA